MVRTRNFVDWVRAKLVADPVLAKAVEKEQKRLARLYKRNTRGASVATFAAGLKAHLETKKKPKLLERRLLKIVNAKPSKRRTAILKLLEERARDKLGVSATAAIDWGNIDWKAILDFLLKLLAILGPLLV